MPNAITINTVQGIGDIFWVYQKLAPHFDVINLRVWHVNTGVVQMRAQAFCKMLPKVGTVDYVQVPPPDYHRLASSIYKLPTSAGGLVEYAVNAPLEAGTNLLDIDPGMAVEQFVDLKQKTSVERSDYLCVFVAGAKSGTVWTAGQWIPHIRRLAARLETKRIVLIGASWDKQVQDPIEDELRRLGYDVFSHVGTMGLPGTIDVIRRARYFLGYQSGLNVLAENYGVPQMMVYFAKLRPMLYTWCKPESVRTRFHACTFADDAGAFIDALPLEAVKQAA